MTRKDFKSASSMTKSNIYSKKRVNAIRVSKESLNSIRSLLRN